VKYAIIIEARAKKEMMALPRRDRQRIDQIILRLADDPHPPGVKSLHGKSKGLWRLRVGNYRIIYQVQPAELIVAIVKVGRRGDVYRGM
jgi:mRNA interferase RelE/StbE